MKYSHFAIILFFIGNGFVQAQPSNYQSETDRLFVADGLIELGKFYPSDFDLFRSQLIAYSGRDKYISVYDYAENNLFGITIGFEDQLQVLEKNIIGKGLGSGPGEFRNPTDICVSGTAEGSQVFVTDPNLARVSYWNIESEIFVNSFSTTRFIPFRIACTKQLVILYSPGFQKRGNYQIYNHEGELIKSIQDQGINREDNSFSTSGFITATESDIYFVNDSKPELKRINIESESVFRKALVSEGLFENSIEEELTKKTLKKKRGEGFRYAGRGIGLYDNFVVVLFSGRKDAFSKTLDFYDKNDLSYKFSIKLDSYTNAIYVDEDIVALRSLDREKKEIFIEFLKLNPTRYNAMTGGKGE